MQIPLWLMMKIYLFLLVGLMIMGTPLHAQEDYPFAWLQNNQLWVAKADSAPLLLAENVLQARYSPQGTRLVYVDDAQNLVWLDTNTLNPTTIKRDTPDALLGNLTWQGENTLWFNLFYNRQREGGSSLLDTDYELWRVELAGELEKFPQNGIILADGENIALLEVGHYGETPARLIWLDSNFQMEFPAVSTGSHIAWLPNLRWTETAIYTAIPHPDLLYDATLPTELIRFDRISGEKTVIGEIQSPFPAEVRWSPDGTHAAYFSAEGALMLYNGARLADVNLGAQLIAWSDDGLSWYDEQFYLWHSDDIIRLTDIWGVAPLQAGFLFLQDTHILFWQNGAETLIADNLKTFDVILVGQ